MIVGLRFSLNRSIWRGKMAEEKIYKCLNPAGIQPPVRQSPLAPRLDTLDGKTIHMCICGEADIWVPLEKMFKANYPKINIVAATGGMTNIPQNVITKIKEKGDAVILGVGH